MKKEIHDSYHKYTSHGGNRRRPHPRGDLTNKIQPITEREISSVIGPRRESGSYLTSFRRDADAINALKAATPSFGASSLLTPSHTNRTHHPSRASSPRGAPIIGRPLDEG